MSGIPWVHVTETELIRGMKVNVFDDPFGTVLVEQSLK